MASALGQPVSDAPADGVTQVRFNEAGELVLASSWDGGVHLYDTQTCAPTAVFSHHTPVLDATFQDDGTVLSGGLDGLIKQFSLYGRTEVLIGRHDQAVRCIEWLPQRSCIATLSWDNTLRAWDPRIHQGSNAVAHIMLPGKGFSLTHAADKLIAATSTRHLLVYDIRRLEQGLSEQKRDSSLKAQTRCVRAFPDATGYAVSSVEGRVAIEYLDLDEAAQAKRYAFKCHRRQEAGQEHVFPVNALAFHPYYGTFASGGGDGVLSMWDAQHKKRICQIPGYATSISAMAFSRDGSMLAVAASYTYEEGNIDHPPDAIFVRPMQDHEVRPKPRAAA